MGLFKDIDNLRKQAKEIGDNYDSKGNLDRGMGRLREAQQMMADQTQAARSAANAQTGGVEATAIIAAVAQSNTMVNYQPALRIDLTVLPDGRPPYPATVLQVVAQIHLAKAAAGRSVPVKVDPADPTSIWIDWDRAAL